jgi:hypothetical protein
MEEERHSIAAPLLSRGETISFRIPKDLMAGFKQDIRIVIKYPGLIGIPIPDIFFNEDISKQLREGELEAIFVPRQSF